MPALTAVVVGGMLVVEADQLTATALSQPTMLWQTTLP